jgi:hypothetical protein
MAPATPTKRFSLTATRRISVADTVRGESRARRPSCLQKTFGTFVDRKLCWSTVMSDFHFPPILMDNSARAKMTISCRDCDSIPKVAQAGEILTVGNDQIQIMHNGIRVAAGGQANLTSFCRGCRGCPFSEFIRVPITNSPFRDIRRQEPRPATE